MIALKLLSSSQILELSVLSLLEKEDLYGYLITQKVQEVIDISESTLYPVLRKLEKNDFVETYNQEFQGRNRKYYSKTAKGIGRLAELTAEWTEFHTKFNELIGE